MLSSLNENERSKFVQKVKELLLDMKNWLNEFLSSQKSNSDEAKTIRQFQDRIDKQIELWDKMLKASIETNQAMKKAGKTVVDEESVTKNDSDVQFAIREKYAREIDEWVKEGKLDNETFILGSTGDVLQGLGAIESDIYMLSDKINTILKEHPEITLEEIKKIPLILENPIMIIKSRGVFLGEQPNTRIVIFGNIKGKDGRPVLTVLDLRPKEKELIIDDMQKVTSAYTKDNNPIEFLKQSDILYADNKKTTKLLKSIGFQMPIELQQSGYIGNISYFKRSVKIKGKSFTDVVKLNDINTSQYSMQKNQENSDTQRADRDSDGNKLSEGQIEFFKDSKARDEDGNLLVVYHGTYADFTVFDRTKSRSNMDIQGSFFSPWELDSKGYGPNVKAYYLNIKNPASASVAYKALNKFKGQNDAGVKAREYLESIGYDGVNFDNEEYIVFNSEQAKITDNLNPTEDKDIRYADRDDSVAIEDFEQYNKNQEGDNYGQEKDDQARKKSQHRRTGEGILRNQQGRSRKAGRESREETTSEFIDRENSEGRTVFLIGNTYYGIVPVDKEDCLFWAAETVEECESLGLKVHVRFGPLTTHKKDSNLTTYHYSIGTTISDGSVVINNDVESEVSGKHVAAHELYHSRHMHKKPDAIRYMNAVKENIIYENESSIEFIKSIADKYFAEEDIDSLDKKQLRTLGQELCAFISGELYRSYRGVSPDMFKDFDSVCKAHQEMIESALKDGEAMAKENSDIQFSDRDNPSIYELLGELETLRKENKNFKEDVARLKERLKLEGQVTNGKKLNENQLGIVAGQIRKIANSTFDKNELVNLLRDYYGYIMSGDGEYMIPIENKIVFTNGDYDKPYIREIIEVLTEHQTEFENVKERIFNVEKGKSRKQDAVQTIRQVFGDEFVISYRSGIDGVYGWENGKRKGKTRRTVISNYLKKQERIRNDKRGEETEVVFSDRDNPSVYELLGELETLRKENHD